MTRLLVYGPNGDWNERTLEQGAAAVLGRRGPLSTDELGVEMAAIGATKSHNPSQAASQAVANSHRFYQLDDGRWLDRVSALRHARLPHEISNVERRVEALRVDPDFSVLADLVRHGIVQAWPGWGALRPIWLRDPTLDARYRPTPERFLLPAHHADPFDRVLVAQAQGEGIPILTADETIKRYAVETIW